jgi:hypothetical protein
VTRNTFYSLSDLFKGSLHKQNKDTPKNYLEKTLSLPEFYYYRLHSPFGLGKKCRVLLY